MTYLRHIASSLARTHRDEENGTECGGGCGMGIGSEAEEIISHLQVGVEWNYAKVASK